MATGFQGLGRSTASKKYKKAKVVSTSSEKKTTEAKRNTTGAGPWKSFEFYSKRLYAFAEQLGEIQRHYSTVFSTNKGTLHSPNHKKQLDEMVRFWRDELEKLKEQLSDVPINKQLRLKKHVDTLSEILPQIKDKSRNVEKNVGELSILLPKAKNSFLRVAAKLDERVRWYRAHPDTKPIWLREDKEDGKPAWLNKDEHYLKIKKDE